MKKRLLFFLLLLTCHQGFSQLGITVAPSQNKLLDWQVLIENYLTHRRTDFLEHGTTAVVDYAFPSKSQVVKFQPAVHFSRATFGYLGHSFETYLVGIQLNGSVYPFRSKKDELASERDYFERIWLQLSPGAGLATLKYDQPQFKDGLFTGEFKRFDDHQLCLSLGAEVGVDFHLSDFLTVAPVVGLRYFPELRWEGFSEAVSKGSLAGDFDETDWRQFMLGLRMELQVSKPKSKKPVR